MQEEKARVWKEKGEGERTLEKRDDLGSWMPQDK
jgi:hypothetical protein